MSVSVASLFLLVAACSAGESVDSVGGTDAVVEEESAQP